MALIVVATAVVTAPPVLVVLVVTTAAPRVEALMLLIFLIRLGRHDFPKFRDSSYLPVDVPIPDAIVEVVDDVAVRDVAMVARLEQASGVVL